MPTLAARPLEHRLQGVFRQDAGMAAFRRKASEPLRNLECRGPLRFFERFPLDQFRQQRPAGNRRDAAARLEANVMQPPFLNQDGKTHDVPASRIADLDRHRRRRQFARVAGVLEVVEHGRAIHGSLAAPCLC